MPANESTLPIFSDANDVGATAPRQEYLWRFSLKSLLGLTTGVSLLGGIGSYFGFGKSAWIVVAALLGLPLHSFIVRLVTERRCLVRQEIDSLGNGRLVDDLSSPVIGAVALVVHWAITMIMAAGLVIAHRELTFWQFLLALPLAWWFVSFLGALLGGVIGAIVYAISLPLYLAAKPPRDAGELKRFGRMIGINTTIASGALLALVALCFDEPGWWVYSGLGPACGATAWWLERRVLWYPEASVASETSPSSPSHGTSS